MLIDDPRLASAAAEANVFAPHFDGQPQEVEVLAVPNVGRGAQRVVPRAFGPTQGHAYARVG